MRASLIVELVIAIQFALQISIVVNVNVRPAQTLFLAVAVVALDPSHALRPAHRRQRVPATAATAATAAGDVLLEDLGGEGRAVIGLDLHFGDRQP